MSITIRPMSPDDVDVVAPVITCAFNAVNARYGYPSEFPEPNVSTLMSRYYLSQDPEGCLVAEQDGNICGSVFARLRGDRVSIGPVTVDPACQAIGVGRRMMQAVFDLYPDAASFRLTQAAFNKESFSLYSKTGFVAAEQLLRFERPPAPVTPEEDEPRVRVVAAENAPLVADLVRRLTDEERAKVFLAPGPFSSPVGDPWTVRKCLRRCLEHQWEHLQETASRVGAPPSIFRSP